MSKIINILIELLKFFCFIGFIVNIFEDNLFYLIFYGVATIMFIILKELYQNETKHKP